MVPRHDRGDPVVTLKAFAAVFSVLAVQLRFTDADEAVIRAYYEALKDLEPEFVALAAQRLGKGSSVNERGEAWFPKAPEWRQLAGKIEGERWAALQAVIRKLSTPLCLTCEDTGWEMITDRQSTRWRHCSCRSLRRLEVLGRRPMPQLQAGS